MRGLLGRAVERRSAASDGGVGWSDPSAIPPNSSFSRQLAGVVVNDMTALQIISVMACVRLISGVVGGFPLECYSGPKTAPTLLDEADAPQLVSDPFVDAEPSEGIEMGVVSLMMRGNAYYKIMDRGPRGIPTLLEPLPLSAVNVRKIAGQINYKVNHVPVDAKDIIHLRWLSLPGAAVGLSPIEYAAQGLGITLAAEEYGARFFAQGAHLAGVLESDAPLSAETARRLARDFQHKHGGLAQAHLPLVLDGGLKWAPIQVPPEQAQFLATRSYQRGEIEALFGVPPHLLGDTEKSTSWGQGIQDQKMDFLTFTIDRYTRKFVHAWNRQLKPLGLWVKFNTEGLLKANTVDRMNAYGVARAISLMTVNEIRGKEGLPLLTQPAADDIFTPLNSIPKPIKGKNDGGDGPE